MVEGLHQRLPRLGVGEIDDGGRSAAGGGNGPGFKAVGAGETVEVQLEMDVAVDAAGDHVAAAGVDGASGVQVCADGCDPVLVDGQVCEDGAGGRDELPVSDHQVMHSRDEPGPTWR